MNESFINKLKKRCLEDTNTFFNGKELGIPIKTKHNEHYIIKIPKLSIAQFIFEEALKQIKDYD